MDSGWDSSARAWISLMGSHGDFSRKHVLDKPLLVRVTLSGARTALDVGCGEGRFCRMMAEIVPHVTGIDPTKELLYQARKRAGVTYLEGVAEDLPFEDGSFDLVVSYLSLIDIEDADAGLAEMARVLRSGGRLLIANLNSWVTASQTKGDCWHRDDDGAASMTIDRYLELHSHWGEWSDMRIQNWHRPLAWYMQKLLSLGLQLVHFDEPEASGGSAAQRYNHAPYLMLMEWQKPEFGQMEKARHG